jgi:hypothetical protein
MPLARVVHTAARIVHGTVTEVRGGWDEMGLPATWVTLDVANTLKGEASTLLTFKQIGLPEPLPDGTYVEIAGLPRYQVGDEVVLFLRGNSAAGFTSPVGFEQGVFRVAPNRGRASVASAPGDGQERLEQLLADIERLVAERP